MWNSHDFNRNVSIKIIRLYEDVFKKKKSFLLTSVNIVKIFVSVLTYIIFLKNVLWQIEMVCVRALLLNLLGSFTVIKCMLRSITENQLLL